MKIIKGLFDNNFNLFCYFLIAVGVFFRIYNLSWGTPYFFHPDERNIASSISQLSLPEQMNPKFFAYGSLPIYVIYFLGVFKNLIIETFSSTNIDFHHVLFEDAIIIGRLVSSLLSSILLFLIYKIAELIGNKKSALLTTTLASLSVGFVQYAHFLTFEIWLSLFVTLLLYLLVKFALKSSSFYLLFIGIVLGSLISIKISSLIFLPLVLFLVFVLLIKESRRIKRTNFLYFEKIILKLTIIAAIASLVVIITSPYFWLDKTSFLGSIKYETDVAIGTLPVFYTQGFIDSIPVIYQLFKIYPFILNPFILILFIIIFPLLFLEYFRKKDYQTMLVLVFFLVTFLSQAFLYVKWTRYYITTLPFIYLSIGLYLVKIKNLRIQKITIFLFIIISLIYAFSFFKTVHFDRMTPITASEWAKKYIKGNPNILSESYDMGIVPFNSFTKITLFNFYDLEFEKTKQDELGELVKTTEYIIIPSQRILKDRIENPYRFPLGNKFYKELFNGKLGFRKIYETPCDLFCKTLYFNNPSYSYETTANAFDRPSIIIFKK